MTRKKKELPLLENVPILDIAAEGKAVARVDGMVVFVPYAVPGDVADLQVRRKKHSFMEADVAKLRVASPFREEPECRYFGVCGGCKWQNLKYEKQLEYKQKQVYDALQRIAKVPFPPLDPIIGCARTTRYRNKLEFGFSSKRWLTTDEIASGEPAGDMNALGFHIPGAFDKILDIDGCLLMEEKGSEMLREVKAYAKEQGLSFFDLRKQEGLLRNMMVRTSEEDGIMVVMQFHWTDDGERAQAMDTLRFMGAHFPEITSLMYVNNLKCNDSIQDLDVQLFKGKDHLMERMEGLNFKVGPKSFFQTNKQQALRLYSVARDFAALTGKELVYDLYTGTGTIANFVARGAREVIGIEYVEEAILSARENAQLSNIGNTRFFSGDMRAILSRDFIQENGRPDVIITDPPRAGMHKDVIDTILFCAPERVVYVSCNPQTQARDIALLSAHYDVAEVQPVDMFPLTHHVENVVLLTLRHDTE